MILAKPTTRRLREDLGESVVNSLLLNAAVSPYFFSPVNSPATSSAKKSITSHHGDSAYLFIYVHRCDGVYKQVSISKSKIKSRLKSRSKTI